MFKNIFRTFGKHFDMLFVKNLDDALIHVLSFQLKQKHAFYKNL